MTNVLVIGYGEVGEAVYKAEKENNHNIKVIDSITSIPSSTLKNDRKIDVMHICIPYANNFVATITYYAKDFRPELIIIHSTVKVGTTQKVRDAISKDHVKHIVHSPFRGVHPNLYAGLIIFIKYVGGDKTATKKAIKYFKSLNVEAKSLGTYETTELAKIMSTSYYGWNILFAKECKIMCDYYGVDFDKVYTEPNKTYNTGYTKLGMEHVVRPVLEPPKGKIGGHCIGANFDLLPGVNLMSDLRRIYRLLNEK